MAGDNWSVNLCDESKKHFEQVMEMAFECNAPGGKAQFFAVTKDNRSMVLLWGDDRKEGDITLRDKDDKEIPAVLKALPYKMGVRAATDFAWNWVQDSAEQGKDIWQDCSRHVGYRLSTNYWGHALGHHYGIIAITGEEQLYGE